MNLRIDISRSECPPKAFTEMVNENIRMSAWDITDFFDYWDRKVKGHCIWIKSRRWDRMQNRLATNTFYRDVWRLN